MKAIIFDTETTGLPKHPDAKPHVQPRVIEFGAVIVDAETGAELNRANFLINPEVEIEEIITKITGLTNDDLRGQPTWKEIAPSIMALFRDCEIMAAHNLPFDSFMLRLDNMRCGIEDWPWPRVGLCTAQENAEIWGRRPKLLELYEHSIGKPLDQTHRASDDAAALTEIIKKEGYFEHIHSALTRANRLQLPQGFWVN